MMNGHLRPFRPLTERFPDDEIVEREDTKKYYFVFDSERELE